MGQEINYYERDQFISWLKSFELKDSTIKNYMFYYDSFGGIENMNQQFIDKYLQGRGRKSIAIFFIKNYQQFLLEFLDPMSQYYPTVRMVFFRKSKGTKIRKLPNVPSKEIMQELYKYLPDKTSKLMFALSCEAGLRVSELIHLKPFNFNWKTWVNDSKDYGELKIPFDIAKGGKGRIVLIPADLMKQIYFWMRDESPKDKAVTDSDFKFWGMSIKKWRKILRKAVEDSGIISQDSGLESITPHTLRHFFATEKLNDGFELIEIKDLLGHASVSTTQIYTHVSKKKIKEKYKKTYGDNEESESTEEIKENPST